MEPASSMIKIKPSTLPLLQLIVQLIMETMCSLIEVHKSLSNLSNCLNRK